MLDGELTSVTIDKQVMKTKAFQGDHVYRRRIRVCIRDLPHELYSRAIYLEGTDKIQAPRGRPVAVPVS